MKKVLRIISMALAILLIAEILPAQAIADGVQRQAQAQTTQAQESNVGNESGILYEVEQERSANAKIFRRTDGTYTALIADEPLHYLKDGVWEEIDNTLEEQPGEEKMVFANRENYFQASFPSELSDDEAIAITNRGYTLSFNMIHSSKKAFKAKIKAKTKEEKELRKKLSEAQKRSNLSERQATITYQNIQTDVDLEYTVLPQSVKENIIFKKKPKEDAVYEYQVYAPKLKAKLSNTGEITFADADGIPVFTLHICMMRTAHTPRRYRFPFLSKRIPIFCVIHRLQNGCTQMNAPIRLY